MKNFLKLILSVALWFEFCFKGSDNLLYIGGGMFKAVERDSLTGWMIFPALVFLFHLEWSFLAIICTHAALLFKYDQNTGKLLLPAFCCEDRKLPQNSDPKSKETEIVRHCWKYDSWFHGTITVFFQILFFLCIHFRSWLWRYLVQTSWPWGTWNPVSCDLKSKNQEVIKN